MFLAEHAHQQPSPLWAWMFETTLALEFPKLWQRQGVLYTQWAPTENTGTPEAAFQGVSISANWNAQVIRSSVNWKNGKLQKVVNLIHLILKNSKKLY